MGGDNTEALQDADQATSTVDQTGIRKGSDAALGGPDTDSFAVRDAVALEPAGAPPEPSAPVLKSATRVGRYEIIEVLGGGGMGVVYRANDPHLSRDVAIKFLHPSSKDLPEGKQYQARLLREARALARLSHPNVVAAYDVGTYGDAVFVAMELVVGVSLRTWLGQNPSQNEVLQVLIAAGRGLAAAHAADVLHRDFKPSNVMVSPDGRIRVVDFGLAREARVELSQADRALLPASDALPLGTKPLDAEQPDAEHPCSLPSSSFELTVTGTLLGTVGYIAPEHVLGEGVDTALDQFSYAATAFAALAGYRPYSGETLDAYRAALLRGERAAWPRSVPTRIRRIIDRGLALRREDRYPSVGAMVDALERAASPKRMPLVIGALALAAVAGALVLPRQFVGTTCNFDAAPFRRVWDAERRTALERAFRDTGRANASEVFELIAGRLDDFRSRWLEMKQEACEATHARADQTEQALGLRSSCLKRKLEGFATLVNVFDVVDASMVDHAGGVRPESLGECADVAALLGAAAKLPDDPERRAWIAEVESGYDITFALLAAGRWQAAVERARASLTLARKADYGPAIALGTFGLGRATCGAARTTEERLEGEALLREGLRLAVQAGDDALVARAASYIFTVTAQQNRIEEAEAMLSSAEALVIRAGNPADQRVELLYGQSNIFIAHRQFAEAIEVLREVERLAPMAEGEIRRYGNGAASKIGSVYADLGRHDEAVAALERGVEAEKEYYGATHPRVLLALINLAIVQAQVRRSAAALATISQAKELAAKLSPDEPSARHIASVEGQVWEHDDDCARAVPFYRAALARYIQTDGANHPMTGDAHAQLGRCLAKTHQLDEGISELGRALAIRRETGAPPAATAQAAFELAEALWSSPAQRPRARTLAEEALALWRREPMPEEADKVQRWLSARSSTR